MGRVFPSLKKRKRSKPAKPKFEVENHVGFKIPLKVIILITSQNSIQNG